MCGLHGITVLNCFISLSIYLFNFSILKEFSLPSPSSSFEVFILGNGDGVEKAQCALTIYCIVGVHVVGFALGFITA